MIKRRMGRQALLLIMAAIVVYMGGGFVRQTIVGRQQREALSDVEAQIEAALQEQASLRAQLEYEQSPQAVEEWARENGWARPEEQSVIVVAPPADPATEAGEAAPELAAPGSMRESWWDLFFADR